MVSSFWASAYGTAGSDVSTADGGFGNKYKLEKVEYKMHESIDGVELKGVLIMEDWSVFVKRRESGRGMLFGYVAGDGNDGASEMAFTGALCSFPVCSLW